MTRPDPQQAPAPISLALYQPDMPGNTGTLMRLCACLGVHLEIIEPCGFVFDDKKLRRAGMDYIDHLTWTRHTDWATFQNLRQRDQGRRLILLTTRGDVAYTDFAFAPDDILLMGRESAGVPDSVHAAANARLIVPLRPPARSLNLAVTSAMVLGEALRQTGGFLSPRPIVNLE